MSKIAMYRRGRPEAVNAGLKEKIIWQLSNGPMTGRQLADKLKVEMKAIRSRLRDSAIAKDKVAKITAGEWVTYEKGQRDRLYTLARRPKRVAPKVTSTQKIVISNRAFSQVGEAKRQKNVIAAQRRSRLIEAGLYITEI